MDNSETRGEDKQNTKTQHRKLKRWVTRTSSRSGGDPDDHEEETVPAFCKTPAVLRILDTTIGKQIQIT